MIRQMVRSAALFAAGLLLANVAWGQPVLTQVSSAAQLVAAEYFGGEARMVQVSNMDIDQPETPNGQQRPYVELNLSGGAIDDGNTADITFVLTGATFDQPVSPNLLDQRAAGCPSGTGAAAPGDDIEATVREGGARGDSSVTFGVEVTDTSAGTLATGQSLCFWIPDLSVTLATVSAPTVMPPVRGVNVTATVIMEIS